MVDEGAYHGAGQIPERFFAGESQSDGALLRCVGGLLSELADQAEVNMEQWRVCELDKEVFTPGGGLDEFTAIKLGGLGCEWPLRRGRRHGARTEGSV